MLKKKDHFYNYNYHCFQDVLRNRWAVLYLLHALSKDPKAKDQVNLM